MNYYFKEHTELMYKEKITFNQALCIYKSKKNWNNLCISNSFVFSHRCNFYNTYDFPEKLHSHSFYEIDIFKKGKVSYLSGDVEFFPYEGDIIIFPPFCDHTAHLISDSVYERYVLYFSKELFTKLELDMPELLFQKNTASFKRIQPANLDRFFELLKNLSNISYEKASADVFLLNALCYELLYLISACSKTADADIRPIPDYIYKVRKYIDDNFKEINTVTELANSLFYSREYMSRIFKRYYNLTVSEYLIKKKIDYAAELLKKGKSVSYACDCSGFKSMSAFIKAFKALKGTLPSKY